MNETLILLLVVAAVVAFWVIGMQARETALRRARTACQRHDLQLLDETVALASLRPSRDDGGRMRLLRTYRFEFTDDGGTRREGTVRLLGGRLLSTHLDLAPFTLHESDDDQSI